MGLPRKEIQEALGAWSIARKTVRRARRSDGHIDLEERKLIKAAMINAVEETAQAFAATKEAVQRIREFLEKEL